MSVFCLEESERTNKDSISYQPIGPEEALRTCRYQACAQDAEESGRTNKESISYETAAEDMLPTIYEGEHERQGLS
jgi:hypothetical protein